VFEVDYSTAAALSVVLIGPAVTSWSRALRCEGALQERYQDRRATATAAITGDGIIPVVARIVVDVHSRVTWPWLGRPGQDQAHAAEDQLQSVESGRMLDEITPLAADIDACMRLQDEIGRWLWGQASAALPYSVCASALILEVSSSGLGLPPWAYWSMALVGSCMVSVWLVFVGLEISARNHLGRLFRRYE
jgi:hypothetical protein